jgi:hypothetical protein
LPLKINSDIPGTGKKIPLSHHPEITLSQTSEKIEKFLSLDNISPKPKRN